MSNDIPAVSVIIPVYNAAEFLKDGLNSLYSRSDLSRLATLNPG